MWWSIACIKTDGTIGLWDIVAAEYPHMIVTTLRKDRAIMVAAEWSVSAAQYKSLDIVGCFPVPVPWDRSAGYDFDL